MKYVVRRIALAVPIILLTTVLVFAIIKLSPGDPVAVMYGMHPGRDFLIEEMEAVRHRLGLDQPIYIQYLDWLWRLLHGDLGYAYYSRTPVVDLIRARIWNSLTLVSASLLFSMALAIPVGVISAYKQYSKTDSVLMGFILTVWALPSWWVGLMLILTFSLSLGWLPVSGVSSMRIAMGEQVSLVPLVIDEFAHLLLPMVTLGLSTGTAFVARLVRSSMLDVLRQDYITAARAKGLKERVVIYRHAFRNAMLPVITMIGMYAALLISYAAAVEYIFNWPGLGYLVVQSAWDRDYPMTMGICLVVSIVVIVSTLVTDLLYAYVDPRIRY